VTRTLRIDSNLEQGIEELADREGVSFNLVANRCFRRLLEWDATAERFGFAQVPLYALQRVFSILTEDQAREMGREAGSNMMPELILFWFKRIDKEAAIEQLSLSAKYARLFTFEHHGDEKSDTVLLKHNRGPRASTYYSELLRALFQALDCEVETQETDGQVVATIRSSGIASKQATPSRIVNQRWNGEGPKPAETARALAV
jgi:hypothetical protein